jgi:outer membrane receptor protein involved in Fe transport
MRQNAEVSAMMLSRYVSVSLWIATVVISLLPAVGTAGTAGKIAGTVYSAETGEPLAGATIRIEEIDIVCVSDADGEFYLINVPVGTYTLSARSIGCNTLAKSEVKVLLDLTTPIDFELAPSTIPTGEVVKVTAERHIIQRDRTSSVNVLTRDELRNLPNAQTLDDIIQITAGTVTDAFGQLHIRGGRDGTNSYYFDEIPVQDPFYGVAATRISPDALEELDVVPGGFSAEYGEALSGVISAMTQEGSNEYHGKLKLYDGLTKPYDVNTGEFGSERRLGRNSGVANLGGPVPFLYDNLKATFFTSSEYRDIEGYLPHNHLNSYSQTGKLVFKPLPDMKVNILGNYYRARQQRYVHRDINNISYDFNLDGLGLRKTESSRLGVRWTYTPRENMVVNARINHFESWSKLAPEHLWDLDYREWPGYSVDQYGTYNGTIHENNYNADTLYFRSGYTTGDDYYPVYAYRKNSYENFSSDLLVQLNKYHQLKIGADYRLNKLKWDNAQFFNPIPYGEKYSVEPRYASAYVQDKIELPYMVVNGGVRFDYLDAKMGYWSNAVEKTDWKTAKPKFQVSPRLGVSHPISENTVIHFNYGLYFQVPLYSYMYTNLLAELNSGFPLVGNPDLEPEKTVGYELGIDHMLGGNVALNLVTYYRDISNLTTTQHIQYKGGSYVAYANADYGSVKGFDIVLRKQPSDNLSGSVNYSYMIARGNASYPYEGYYDYYTLENPPVVPTREYPLAFDQRHTLSVNIDFRIPKDHKAKVFGLKVPSAWGLNTLAKYGSGMPYTKTDNDGNRVGMLNEGRMPATYTVDMRLNKDIFMGKTSDMFLSLYIEVENLFDRRNVINVYSNTGNPDDDGSGNEPRYDPDGTGPLTVGDVERIYGLLAMDPQNYDTPRTIRWGLEFVF